MALQKEEKAKKQSGVKEKKKEKKVQTDNDVKRKAVKLVIAHLKRKLPENDFSGKEQLLDWISDMEELLAKEEFVLLDYIEMRRNLNDIIERTFDEELRFKLRDSWYSMGRALDKKVRQR
ncbi:MAG: hypothetical protein WBL32_01825 [Acetivibrionales bacterium]|jgi:flagellar biosynthesis component FlhA|nr:hypothetical protein [Bacillota bacterium]NLP08002.1 hypothetical protein [Clostridiaceae bacterium]HOA54885.1 hypothetical protein [Clostridiales bacterium]HQD31321.1 hypothetical protein [Clostridiales bacterium]